MVLVDTCVLVAYLCPEPLHARAHKALASAPTRLLTPLVRLEAISALAIKTRTGELPVASARLVRQELDRQIDQMVFQWREIEPTVYQQAGQWLAEFHTSLRALDALHLACALEFNAKLLTADKLLARAARTLNIPCKLLE